MRNNRHIMLLEALKQRISCLNKHTFYAICLITHRLQHMRPNFWHRLVQEQHLHV